MTFPPSPASFFSRSAVSLSMISSFFLSCGLWTYHFPFPSPLLLNMGCLKVLNLKSITGSHPRIRTMHFLLSSFLTSSGVISSLPHCQVNTSLFWIFVYYNMIVKAVDLLSSPSLIRRSPEYPLFKQSRAATTRNTSYGVLKPALLCSVLACCAAELQRIKPYLGLRWTEKINR